MGEANYKKTKYKGKVINGVYFTPIFHVVYWGYKLEGELPLYSLEVDKNIPVLYNLTGDLYDDYKFGSLEYAINLIIIVNPTQIINLIIIVNPTQIIYLVILQMV